MKRGSREGRVEQERGRGGKASGLIGLFSIQPGFVSRSTPEESVSILSGVVHDIGPRFTRSKVEEVKIRQTPASQ